MSMEPNGQLPCDSHETRISVLETKTDYIESSISSHAEALKVIDAKVDKVNEQLARQNGTLPHMSDAIQSLTLKMDSLNEAKWQTKTMWAIIGVIGSGIVALLFKYLSGR